MGIASGISCMVHPMTGDIPSITGVFDMACYSYVYPLKGTALQSREMLINAWCTSKAVFFCFLWCVSILCSTWSETGCTPFLQWGAKELLGVSLRTSGGDMTRNSDEIPLTSRGFMDEKVTRNSQKSSSRFWKFSFYLAKSSLITAAVISS